MITYESISNPRWADINHTSVFADVKWDVLDSVVTQVFTLADVAAPHVLSAYAQIINGDFGDIAEYVAPPAPHPNIVILAQILVLEKTVTQRRLREATLGTDNGWLANLNAQIVTLRESLI